MSNDKNVFERLFKLLTMVSKMILDGVRDPLKVADYLQEVVDNPEERFSLDLIKEEKVSKEKETNNLYLKSFTTGVLKATTGQRTLANADNIFTGYLDSKFVDLKTDIKGQSTKETPFEVFEQIGDGTLNQIFGSFDTNLDRLCWSQDQIITFVEGYSDMLHPAGYPTFFLFKVGKHFLVACAHWGSTDLLAAYVCPLSYDHVWDVGWDVVYRYRFVVPQSS